LTPPPVALAHTADLSPDELAGARALMYRCFEDLTEPDWEHALGGMHALAYDEQGQLIGHGALVQRRLIHRGRALRTGYVEAVGVDPAHRRRGHAGRLMAELERIIRGAYERTSRAS
jgi:aminoglycoside 2'-N-acetyltransferase I